MSCSSYVVLKPDIESDLPRVEEAFHRLGITPEDIERGKQRLNKYYDIKLLGVRKALRLHLRDVAGVQQKLTILDPCGMELSPWG